MNPRIPFTAVVTGALVGLTGALAVLTPASAGAPAPGAALTATASCTDTGWKVRWKLTTTGTDGADGCLSDVRATITDYEVPPGLPGAGTIGLKFPALTTFVDNGKVTGDAVLIEDQALIPDIYAVELTFTVTWNGKAAQAKNVRAVGSAPKGCTVVAPTATGAVPPPIEESFEPDPAFPGVGTPVPLPIPITSEGAAGAGGDAGASGGEAGGGLAVTGAAAGTAAVVAALLLAVGAVLFVVSRRRRVRFTA